MKLDVYRQIFEKLSNSKYHEFRPVGAELLREDGQTDRRTEKQEEANTRFSQFCECA